jgi:hypothetical protein
MCDCRQFSYVGYENKDTPYKYTSQVGVILKREYPTVLVEDRDENGALIRKCATQEWADYFFSRSRESNVSVKCRSCAF